MVHLGQCPGGTNGHALQAGMALIGNHAQRFMNLDVDRTAAGALATLGAGVVFATDFKNAEKKFN